MKSFTRFVILGIPLAVMAAALPFVASAQTTQTTAPPIWPTGYWGVNPPLLSCNGNYPINGVPQSGSGSSNYDGEANCASLNDLVWTFVNIVYFLMTIALFVIAPILFIVGGIMMMISAGNSERISQAKSTMLAAVVGVVIVLCAYLVLNVVITALNINCIGNFSSGGVCNS